MYILAGQNISLNFEKKIARIFDISFYLPPVRVRCLIKVEEAGGRRRRLLAVHSKTHQPDIFLKQHPLIQYTFSRLDDKILANRVFNPQPLDRRSRCRQLRKKYKIPHFLRRHRTFRRGFTRSLK